MATFFLLAGLLLFTMTVEGDSIALHIAALACFAVAALSKESAFIFPLLVAGYALAKRQRLKSTVPYFALAAILFAYRWSLFGGIGGYINPATGRPAALSLGSRFDSQGGGGPAVDLALFSTELEPRCISARGPALGAARRGLYGGDPMAGGAGATGANAVARGGGDSDLRRSRCCRCWPDRPRWRDRGCCICRRSGSRFCSRWLWTAFRARSIRGSRDRASVSVRGAAAQPGFLGDGVGAREGGVRDGRSRSFRARSTGSRRSPTAGRNASKSAGTNPASRDIIA